MGVDEGGLQVIDIKVIKKIVKISVGGTCISCHRTCFVYFGFSKNDLLMLIRSS